MELAPGVGVETRSPHRPAAAELVHVLFARHANELRRYAQRIVTTRDAAEDVVQDVFLRLWLRRDRVELGGAMRSYLYLSTRARAFDALARLRRDARRGGGEAAAERVDAVDVTEPLDGARIECAIAHVMATMPPRQRAVATLRLHHHRSAADIGRELGISPRTVEAHVARATRTLRAQLPRLLHTDS
jgi:RNA polymerase sigma factor (sigma-70 family)